MTMIYGNLKMIFEDFCILISILCMAAENHRYRQGLCPPHAGFSPHEKTNKIEQGGPSSPLEPSEGHLNWRMGLPAFMGGNLGCRIV